MSSSIAALYSADQVRALDRVAIEQRKIDGYRLMRRAGKAAFDAVQHAFPRARRVVILCGGGNNGGDGYVVGRLARAAGLAAEVVALSEPGSKVAQQAAQDYRGEGGESVPLTPEALAQADLILDGLLGTGLERPVTGAYGEAIAMANALPQPVVALDIPSGLHADTGRIMGQAVRADLTVTFIGRKPGLYTGRGRECAGTIHFADLDVPPDVYEGVAPLGNLIDPAMDPSLRLPPRSRDAHKGDAGRVLVIAGDRGMQGAARLCGEAAYRAGAGLVRVVTHPDHAAALCSGRPELLVSGLGSPAGLDRYLREAGVVAVGPGLGQRPWGRSMLAAVLDANKPLVVDADALNLLAQDPVRRADWVMTPHPGEAARLLGLSVREVQDDRIAAARAIRRKYGGVALLKGAGTVVVDEAVAVNPTGTPAMASGGMGDVLTGMIAAFMAQGMPAGGAARFAAWVHGRAAELACEGIGEVGLIASDLFPWIRRLMATRIA